MYETINEKLKSHFYTQKDIKTRLQNIEADVLNNRKSSFQAAQQLLDEYLKK